MANIRQVARLAGVSAGTVSRVLNKDSSLRVTNHTRTRILAAVKTLNYQPKKRNENLVVGILTTMDLDQVSEYTYYQQIKQGILEELKRSHITLSSICYLSENIPAIFWNELSYLDGIIVIGGLSDSAVTKLKKINANIVIIENRYQNNMVKLVNANLAAGVTEALDQLEKFAQTEIAYAGGPRYVTDLQGKKTIANDEVRLKCYSDWMKLHDQKECTILTPGWSIEDGIQAGKQMALLPKLPKGILAGNDQLAIGIMQQLHTEGFHAPQDFHIIGFDNIQMAQYYIPRLSSVSVPEKDLGTTAVNLVKEQIMGRGTQAATTLLEVQLILRESTGN